MEEIYIAQRLARQSCQQIVPIPEDLQIPERHLHGIENVDFIKAFHTYQDILKQMYEDVKAIPESFGMICIPIEYSYQGPMSKEEDKSRKSFFRLPAALLALAYTGELTSDGGLSIEVKDLEADLKAPIGMRSIPKLEMILARLTDYGFEIEGLPENFNYKKAQQFTICYPDDKNVMVVLKAFGNVGLYERMVSADYRNLLSEQGYHKKYDLKDIERILYGSAERKLFAEVNERLKDHNLRTTVDYIGYMNRVKYFIRMEKKEAAIFDIGRDDQLSVKIHLPKIAGYSHKLKELSENIIVGISNGRDCIDCGYCKTGGVDFEYEGKSYHKCSMLCCNFHFTDFTEKNYKAFLKLLELELSS